MKSVGITGHQKLNDASLWDWVKDSLELLIFSFEVPFIGLTSLAIGADQTFAKILTTSGIKFKVILPFSGYERTFNTPEDLASFHRLLSESIETISLACARSDEECFLEAGKLIVSSSNLMIAVWDGQEAKGLGGTADIVKFAISRDVPVLWLDPTIKAVKLINSASAYNATKWVAKLESTLRKNFM